MKAEELIHELPKGLILWYPFHKGAKALYILGGTQDSSMIEALESCGLRVDTLKAEEMIAGSTDVKQADYTYAVAVGAVEHCDNPVSLLSGIHRMLEPDGKLLLGTDNRLAVRYFCGDRDPYTGRNFDGIENYTRVDSMSEVKERAYSKSEIAQMLKEAGFENRKFYSVLPELKAPQVIISENYNPQEELNIRIFPQYNYPDTVFLEEEKLYTSLIQNNMFHSMANAFFIECPLNPVFSNVNQVTVSMDRGERDAMATLICDDKTVAKKPLYEKGYDKIRDLTENTEYLQHRGISMIEGRNVNGAYMMPYVVGQPATEYFKELLCRDRDEFLVQLDYFWQLILKSSEHVRYDDIDWLRFEPNWDKHNEDDPERYKWRDIAYGSDEQKENLGVILKRGYLDLVSLNCFYVNGDFVFYDQEKYNENVPAKAILLRTIDFIYSYNTKYEKILPRQELLDRYGLTAYQNLFYGFAGIYLAKLRNDRELQIYHGQCRRDNGVIHSNRQRMNYSADEYDRLFRDIFKGAEGRELYLFGSGNFTKKFLSQFGKDYQISGILDNNEKKWGTQLEGIPVYPPDHLLSLTEGSYKVIICIKGYLPVMGQLQKMGVSHFSIYDSNAKYTRPLQPTFAADTSETGMQPKKYHVGYIAGVFDLFHIGHLNMFKRAKEQCDYLIVGIVNDESVLKKKRTVPFIPFEERVEMVQSCRYVDEVVEIPTEYNDSDEAYRRYQFDVQFSGSDYQDSPEWLAKKEYLRKQGSDLVFFPYTESTSSSKLKKLIESRQI